MPPPPCFLLLSKKKSQGVEYPFGQFKPAILVVIHPQALDGGGILTDIAGAVPAVAKTLDATNTFAGAKAHCEGKMISISARPSSPA